MTLLSSDSLWLWIHGHFCHKAFKKVTNYVRALTQHWRGTTSGSEIKANINLRSLVNLQLSGGQCKLYDSCREVHKKDAMIENSNMSNEKSIN